MDKLIRQIWWKALGVGIMVYVFTVGMLVPLKPGITTVAPGAARTGTDVTLDITGYNTHFLEAEDSVRFWLKLDNERALAARAVQVLGNNAVKVTFAFPEYLPVGEKVQPFSIIMDNAVDGAIIRPDAVYVTQDSINPALGDAAWDNAPIADLHTHVGMTFPFRNILGETIRNTYYHVSLWLAMMLIFIAAMVYSVRYLRTFDSRNDHWAAALTTVGVLLGWLGMVTGAIWAKFTWGAFWSWDIKQFTTLIALLIYMAYFVLRRAFPDEAQQARVSAVYNVFAFVALIPLIYVLPRLTDSLHPGNGGNPAFGSDDLDNTMRMVFYPAVIGWTLIGGWIASLLYRTARVEESQWDGYETGSQNKSTN